MPAPTINWYRTPVDPALLDELNQRDDRKGLAQSAGYLGAMIGTGAAAVAVWALVPMPWLIPALVAALLLHGTVCAFNINGVHELVHGTVFQSKKLNWLFVHVFAFLGWINHYHFWASHTEHHKYTLHAPDDLEVVLPQPHDIKGFFKHGFISWRWPWDNLKHQWRTLRGRWRNRWTQHILPEEDQRKQRRVRTWAGVLLGGHLLIAAVSIAAGWWIIPVVTSLTPMYGRFLFLWINNTQHCGLADKVPDFRLCCRTITLNPVLSFLYWHMEYHTEHHMYAGVPCYHLKRLHEAVKHDLPPSCHGLVETWAQILYIQHRQKHDPDFQYIQPLPEHAYATPEPEEKESETPAGEPDMAGHSEAASPEADATEREPVDAETPQAAPTVNSRGGPLRRWECSVCGFIYDEAVGWPEDGIVAGTAWEDIPEDWSCPDCGVAKADFDMIDVTDAAVQ